MNNAVAKQPQETELTHSGVVYRPRVDIVERGDELLLRADLPGARSETIDIQFEDGQLVVHAQIEPRGVDGGRPLWQEYGVGNFHRTFRVSEQIDAARMHADFRDGVLTVHLPKVEAVKPRKISVQAAT